MASPPKTTEQEISELLEYLRNSKSLPPEFLESMFAALGELPKQLASLPWEER